MVPFPRRGCGRGCGCGGTAVGKICVGFIQSGRILLHRLPISADSSGCSACPPPLYLRYLLRTFPPFYHHSTHPVGQPFPAEVVSVVSQSSLPHHQWGARSLDRGVIGLTGHTVRAGSKPSQLASIPNRRPTSRCVFSGSSSSKASTISLFVSASRSTTSFHANVARRGQPPGPRPPLASPPSDRTRETLLVVLIAVALFQPTDHLQSVLLFCVCPEYRLCWSILLRSR